MAAEIDGVKGADRTMTLMTYQVEAYNTAVASENRMHSDEVASQYGFSGGLVPGVDVYAYLTHLPAARWGLEWLQSGSIICRFHTPVYDGDLVSVVDEAQLDGGLTLELKDSTGERCATARASAIAQSGDADWQPIDSMSLPAERPAASSESLAKGTVLGSIAAGFHADLAGEYLAEVREALPLYAEERVAHPGWLLRFANRILVQNVKLGPWIHVGSDVRFLDVVRDGEQVECLARVTDEYEKSGHKFVVLDVALTANGRPVQRILHTSIYEPRRGPKST